MNIYPAFASGTRFAAFLGAAALIGLTSFVIRAQWNDMIYLINAMFLLFGGDALGRKATMCIKALFDWRKRQLLKRGPPRETLNN